uniref:Uncharacterized protein n=1 Tax=Pyxicephalus adspersus TaxID=30357 RepID=A0AAV3B135_PYXAD|nr:TPA: hypothetical protein GDO54_008685 [Pyxicephalus adspersus]
MSVYIVLPAPNSFISALSGPHTALLYFLCRAGGHLILQHLVFCHLHDLSSLPAPHLPAISASPSTHIALSMPGEPLHCHHLPTPYCNGQHLHLDHHLLILLLSSLYRNHRVRLSDPGGTPQLGSQLLPEGCSSFFNTTKHLPVSMLAPSSSLT